MDPFVQQLVHAWNSHDRDQVAVLYAPDYVGVDVAQAVPQHGSEGLLRTVSDYWHAFPDLHFTVEHVLVQKNQIALFWQATGTHLGSFLHIPASGRTIQVRGAGYHRLAQGKIVHSLYIWDTAGLLRGLGLLPELNT